jgi:syntaxin-binding protein 1
MSDILDQNVSMVEDLGKKREPSPLVAVYFIQPSSASITQLIDDFSTGQPLYPSVHVFFSSKVCKDPAGTVNAAIDDW